MKDFFKTLKISSILAALLYVALGAVLLIWPDATGKLVCFAFGMVLLVYGAISIISFFVHDSRQGGIRFDLILGILIAAVGIVFLAKPVVVLSIFPVILGIYIVVDALLNAKRALELRDMRYGRWWVALVLSLVSAGLGVLVLFRPGMTAEVLIMVIGGVFIYNGLSDLWSIVQLGRVAKALRKDGTVIIDPLDF